jgi:hypothetical protein
MHGSLRASAAGGSLILRRVRDRGAAHYEVSTGGQVRWQYSSTDSICSLSYLSRIDRRFGPAVSGVVMSEHVPDDEVCWCGVPLECHDDLYDAIRGWHHQPDPVPPPLVTGACARSAGETAHLVGKRRACEPASQ